MPVAYAQKEGRVKERCKKCFDKTCGDVIEMQVFYNCVQMMK